MYAARLFWKKAIILTHSYHFNTQLHLWAFYQLKTKLVATCYEKIKVEGRLCEP